MEFLDYSYTLSVLEHMAIAGEALASAEEYLNELGSGTEAEREVIEAICTLILASRTRIRNALDEANAKDPVRDMPDANIRVGAALRTAKDILRHIEGLYISRALDALPEHEGKCFKEAVRDAGGEYRGRLIKAFDDHFVGEI